MNKMKIKKVNQIIIILVLIFFQKISAQKLNNKIDIEKSKVTTLLDDLNKYASEANFQKYFSLYAEESTFIGTDAKEIWNKKQFMDFAKPYFDRGKAWNFKSLKRNIAYSKDLKYAWFDELLDTQMKICRGSGVLEKINGTWKIKQYVLSMTIPNENVDEVVKTKSVLEDELIKKLNQK